MKKETIDDVISNETLTTIYKRRAVRKYLPNMIEEDLLEKIIDAGRMAPSAMNKQPWKFYVLTHKDTIAAFSKEIAKISSKVILKTVAKHPVETFKTLLHFSPGPIGLESEDPIFHGAPVVVFITAHKNNEWSGLDIGMCAQNMMLAAKSLGLESCPVGFAKYIEQTPIFHKLEVPDKEEVHLAIILGYGDENPEPHARLKDNVIFVDRMECC